MCLIIFLLYAWISLAFATCYSRNGTLITNIAYQPCGNDKSRDSVCCGTNHSGAGETNIANDICEENGLCQNWEGKVDDEEPAKLWWRQGCTDPTWESPFCLKDVCSQGLWQNDNAPVRSCPGGKWCCGDPSCCNISSSVFALAATVGPTSTHTSSSASSTISSRASITMSPSRSTTQPGTAIGTSNSVPTASSTSASSKGLSTPAKIGIGIGIPVVAVLLGIIGILLWKLRRRENSKMPSEMDGGYEKTGRSDVYAHYVAPVELDGRGLPVEAGGVPRAELTGDEGVILRTDDSRRKHPEVREVSGLSTTN